MQAATFALAAASLIGSTVAHGGNHEHLHKRQSATASAPSTSTPCPAWTGGPSPPAYLTALPSSIQAELPAWTGAPPPDWCSYTSWMMSYTSCNFYPQSCGAATTTSSSSTSSASLALPTNSANYTGSGYKTGSVWSAWNGPSASPTSTSNYTGTWTKPYPTGSFPVEPATTSETWAAWQADPTASTCGCTTTVVTSYGEATWAPNCAPSTTTISSTAYTTVTVLPTPEPTSSSETWSEWDPSTSTSSSASSSATTSWAAWTSSAPAPVSSTPSATGSSASSTSTGTAGGSGNAGINPNGSLWAITYSPYTSSGGCKDAGSIATDVAAIAKLGFTTIRIYSTDCSGLQNIGGAAQSNGLKLILGVYIDASGIPAAQPQVTEIVSWGQWDMVEMIVVGNEALFNNYCDVSDLSAFISSSAWAFKNAGYTGPVTTTEELSTLQSEGSQLCGVMDVVAANVHAYFNAQTTAAEAGTFVAAELVILDTICPGKPVYITESGWPTAGDANGAAIPGVAEQKTALMAIQQTCGSQVVFFSFEDDTWKDPGPLDVEQHWGCAGAFGGTTWSD